MREVWSGTLTKMRSEHVDPVAYFIRDGWFEQDKRGPELQVNDLLGRRIEIHFGGQINCVVCGRKTKKTFNQGYCYPCSQTRPEADICIIKPELCHYGDPANPCRDEHFAQTQCFQPHILYVSLTSGVKVGITRRPNVPSRWIDQGAVRAIPIAELPSRREVGLVEVKLAEQYADKTHWMRMLKEKDPAGDLSAVASEVVSELESMGVAGVLPESERTEYVFDFPVLEYPTKVKSFNLDKTPEVGGELLGIKGQYLIFDNMVINVRKYTGYRVTIQAEGP
jgi:hypothetical protein